MQLSVEFFLAGPAGPPPNRPSDARRSSEPRRARRRAMIVEDQLMVALSLEAHLENFGIEVAAICATGEEALAAAAGEELDLLMMDINLGAGIDGIETARRIAADQQVSVIFVSAYADKDTRRRIRETIPQAMLLGKPLTPVQLEEAIRQAADTRH